MNDVAAQISLLDQAWSKLTGQVFKARGVVNWREADWQRFIAAGYGVKDLETVILALKSQIRGGKRHPACLRFRSLIGDLARFEDEEAAIVAEIRNANPAKPPLESVLESWRPTMSETPPEPSRVKRPREYIEKLIADMRKSAS